MLNPKSRVWFLFFACAAFFLFACETTNFIQALASNPTRIPPTPVEQSKKKSTRAPDAPYDFIVQGTPRCASGDNSVSIVNGKIFQNGAPVAGQKIQASSGPGAEPISEEPALSNDTGDFQITFVCGGSACNGAFWVWLINDDAEQISPFVEFIFDKQCRHGQVNFSNP